MLSLGTGLAGIAGKVRKRRKEEFLSNVVYGNLRRRFFELPLVDRL